MRSFANQDTPAFRRKIRWKITLLYQILTFGVNLLYIDCDVILLKNPFPYLTRIKKVKMSAQQDAHNICTGFMYIVSSPQSRRMMKLANRYVQKNAMDDQEAVNVAVKKRRMPVLLLPLDLFPNGEHFFMRYQFVWDRKGNAQSKPAKDCPFYMFHNNFVRGKYGKDLRFKEMGLYSIDFNGEYSENRRYLTVEKLGIRCCSVLASFLGNEKTSLKRLARLANLLDRTAVLPPFPCSRASLSFCNLCHFDRPDCFKNILPMFNSPVRESIFFTNPFVPDAIKREERDNPIYSFSHSCSRIMKYKTSFPPRLNHNNTIMCVPCSGSLFQCIRDYEKTVPMRVFRLFSLFSVCLLFLAFHHQRT